MRPTLLDPLFAPLTSLDGVGQKLAAALAKLIAIPAGEREPRIVELLLVLPHAVIDRRERPGVAMAQDGAIVTLELHIDRVQFPPSGNSRAPFRIHAHDDTGEITLVYFRASRKWLEKLMPVGADVIVSGRMEYFNGRATMVHPDHVSLAEDATSLPLLEPVYPLTAGLSARVLHKILAGAMTRIPQLSEWIDAELCRREAFPAFRQALETLHHPSEPADISPNQPARRRLAYDELLAGQLSLALVRLRTRKSSGRPLVGDGTLISPVRGSLPYLLTGAQERALEEISTDMGKPERMLRLLQGDVGSGKTVVALLAMVQAVEAGGQAALMAPTEILARQHFQTLAPLARQAGLTIAVLTSRESGATRREILSDLEVGKINLMIGTHALFQSQVTFHNLALAVIDEQHRFGVHQRLHLGAKGVAPDMLVMTATPIPRTLVMTAFGDMDVSRLDEKPPGRKPVTTTALPLERMDSLLERLRKALDDGRKIYWICPLVEDSELVDLTSAQERFSQLEQKFGARVGLIHGRMNGPEKDTAMLAFKSGETRLLVGTTVVEVGVDVSDATIMVIEHAERFGLAQLHQLRGRIGRADEPSSCVLLYKHPLGEIARQRISILRESEDGFRIAEEDLKLRGEGELLGTRQSGSPGFATVLLEHHADLLQIARVDARMIIDKDPQLTTERGTALRMLLYLFGRDEAIRLLRAG